MSLCCWLALVTLVPVALSTNPGVEIKLTQKGLEYGKHCNTSFFFEVKKKKQQNIIKISFHQADNWEWLQSRRNSKLSKSQIFQGKSECLQSGRSSTACQSKAAIYLTENLEFPPSAFKHKHVLSSSMQIVDVGLPTSAVELVSGTGVKLSIANAFISMRGNWRVKYLRVM